MLHVRSIVLDEMGDTTPPPERLAYFSQFEARFSGSIDFEEYVNVSHAAAIQNNTQQWCWAFMVLRVLALVVMSCVTASVTALVYDMIQ